jgi:cyclophilin family peptidyl-prolyl cis-trans isomerase
MSQIYNLEPPTKGKVVLHTTHGDIEIELWPKEAPKVQFGVNTSAVHVHKYPLSHKLELQLTFEHVENFKGTTRPRMFALAFVHAGSQLHHLVMNATIAC